MLSLRIAYKYLSSKKSHSVVNLIARTAVISIAVPVAAAVLVLSLQKGLSNYIGSMYNDFDAPLKVYNIDKQPFVAGDSLVGWVQNVEEVQNVSKVLEGEVLLEYSSLTRRVATVKGVDSAFSEVVSINERVTHGTYQPRLGDISQLIIGQGIAYYMGINPAMKKQLSLYWLAPESVGGGIYGSLPNYNKLEAMPVAIFAIDETVDSRYVIADLEFTQRLLRKPNMITSLDLAISQSANLEKVKKKLESLLGDKFIVLTRHEQHASLFRIMNIERWIIFALLVMITALASLTLCGTIIMMKTEKKIQNKALLQMGFRAHSLRRVFTSLGVMITAIGLLIGLLLGFTMVWVQATFGFLKMGGTSLLLDAYPVSIDLPNIMYLIVVTALLGFLISYFTSRVVNRS